MSDIDDRYDAYDRDARTLIRELVHVPEDVAICGLIFGSLCTVSALFGNFLIVTAFLSERGLRRRQNALVISAALMELAVVFVKDAFLLAVYSVGSWQFGDTLMKVNKIASVSRNGLAIGHAVAITIYQYALIVHPSIYRLMARTPVLMTTLSLVFGVPLALSFINFSRETFFNAKGMLVTTEVSLGIGNGTLDREAIKTNLVPVVVYVSLNGLIVLACNVNIYFFIKRSSSRVTALWGAGVTARRPTTLSRRSTRKELKFVKIMAGVFGSFFASYFTMPLLVLVDGEWRLSYWVYLPLVMINWFSSSVNWVIYSLNHSGFRVAVRRILTRRC